MIVNIYLNEKDISDLKKKEQKYLVSLSTIADKVISNFLKAVNHASKESIDEENIQVLNGKKWQHYLYDHESNDVRTSIKPRIYKWYPKMRRQIATDCLKMYARNGWNKIFKNKSDIDKMLSAIDLDLKEVYDKFYNYNEQLRNSIRVIKENKDYIERLQKKAKEI